MDVADGRKIFGVSLRLGYQAPNYAFARNMYKLCCLNVSFRDYSNSEDSKVHGFLVLKE